MSSTARWRLLQRASRLGRLLGRGRAGGERRIRSLPPPLSAWTGTRDAPVPPPQTFQEQWAREHGRSSETGR